MSYFIHFNQCFSFQFCGLQFFSISFTKVVKFAKSFQKKNPLTPQKQIIDFKIDAHVELKMMASIKVQSETSILEKDMKMQIMEMLAFCSQPKFNTK